MKGFIVTAALVVATPAAAQTVVAPTSVCPAGYHHEGEMCVLHEGGHVYRYPYRDFLRGGRFFGRGGFHVHRRPVIVHRPGRPGTGIGRPGGGRPGHGGRH